MFLYNRTLQLLKNINPNKLLHCIHYFDCPIRQKSHASIMSMKKALIILTEGAEELELVITADVLRRAQVCFSIFFLLDKLNNLNWNLD